MNLSNQEKKLFSRIALVIGGILIIAFGYWGIKSIIQHYQDKRIQERLELVKEYKATVDSIKLVNINLELEREALKRQVDSLEIVKNKIYWKYGKEIITIYDASSVDHAKWLDSVLEELNNQER